MTNKFATTSVPVLETITKRWSPRAYDAQHTLTEADLLPAFEAARWAPSASNLQPASFITAFRGTESFDLMVEHLLTFNSAWAKNASALIVNVALMHDDEGRALRWAEYDLGQAVSYFTIQAHADGLFVHQMGGFNADEMALALDLPEAQRVVSVMAVGAKADPNDVQLTERHLAQEVSERTRKELDQLVDFRLPQPSLIAR